MGSNDLFHKRKAKQARDLARKKARRASYAKVLIVCEGEKTEPNYFNELKDHLSLNSANIEITGDCGSSPISIVDHAIQCYKAEKTCGDTYDKVFCVFDKDSHETYHNALQKIEDTKPKDTFCAITSVPCFEYWLLLHFIYTTAQYQRAGNRSACDLLIRELHNYLPGYQKGDGSTFEQLVDQLQQAKIFAARALNDAGANQDDNPSTKVHELVNYLENIKDQ